MTESVNGMLDRTRSGRAAVQSDNTQALLHRLGPIFAESLVMKKVPGLQIASYMAMAVFVSKGNLEDNAVTAFMQQTVYGWTAETVRPGLVCLAIMAQFRSAKQMNGKVTKALMKVHDIGPMLVEIGKERRVDKLANGLCLALIERFTKKGDSRGLPTIMAILGSQILKEKQTAVIFKSLLLTALKLDDTNDADGALRRELGSALIALSQTTGKSGDIIQSVIQEVEFDIEELEMKLDLSFRTRKLPETAATTDDVEVAKKPQDLSVAVDELASRKESLSPCLLPQPNELFEEFSHLFFSIVSESSQQTDMMTKFDGIPQLGRDTALKDCTYFSFFIRIWCGPYPALARMAALNMVKNRLKTGDANKMDMQALVPYSVTALSDPSKRVRQAAGELIAEITELYTPPVSAKSTKTWGSGLLYGKAKEKHPLAADVTAKLLHLQIFPSIEECVMDPEHISSILKSAIEQGKYQVAPQPALDKKDHMGQSARLAVLSFFASHAELTPLILVKNRLLKSLNNVKGVGSTSRTQVLLPLLNWWTTLSESEIQVRCATEQHDVPTLDSRFVDVVVANDTEGLEFLFTLLKDPAQREKADLMRAIFGRVRKMWPSMKDEIKFMVAEQFLALSQEPTSSSDEENSVVSAEASELLRAVPLTTDILSFFLDSIQTGTKMITEPPPNKRRRTSSTDASRSLITQVTPELSQALRKVTFVLQLVDNSDPLSHPELLDGLFTALSELQHFRTVVGSELGYLQNLILRSLLAMMPAYKADKELKIDSSGGYGDLLVNCIQKSSSPVVQNAALLLVANLATTAPNLVLHSVMPIFTFMGTSVLRQSDDYSAHVVSQTIKEVVPPLIESLRQGKKSPVAGASDILVSFTTAYEHIPSHRRQGLFVALVETLGSRDFLFALISMLVDRYDTSEALLSFIVDLLNNFDIKTQLETFIKILDLVADLFKPKPGMSFVLLGISEDGDKDIEKVALRQLSALPSFLANKKLRSQIGKLTDREDMEAAEVREFYATLLENILLLADTVKANKTLHGRCGSSLSNLLNLLSIGEFIKAVENLLDRPDLGLRQKVLRALEVRVETESNTDPASRNALLAFLPQLTAAIRESSDIRYKHTAVTCVDKIAEKYGKKDVEAVVAAAATIAGEHCLGQEEQRLRIMSLLCLTSLVDVLQDAVVPVLPIAIPQAVKYLEESLEGETPDEELHSACYGFISSLAEHLPYMLSTYLDKILHVSNRSAQADLDDEASESRTSCLEFLAKKLDAKEIFSAVDRNWERAMETGFSVCSFAALCKEEMTNYGTQAIDELLAVFLIAVDKHNKSSITKNISVLCSILLKAFDLRRQVDMKDEKNEAALREVTDIETKLNETSLKMIYKLNDAAFRPLFVQIVEWTTGLPKSDKAGRNLRQYSVYGFLNTFFSSLKSIVTNYATYVVDDAVKILAGMDPKSVEDRQLWSRVLQVLATCFEHDQDDFWQAPSHFGTVAPLLLDQFLHAGSVDVSERLIPAVVELAATADSQAHQKEINASLMKHLKSEQSVVRLAAIKCEQALTDRLGEEWLSMLHEMLPRISELQEDDDEVVERETHRWIVKIEGVLGESLDAMLQ